MAQHFVTRFPDYQPSGRLINGRRIAVGIDIDGCVDPGMYKHEPGFAIASLYHYKLQMITPVAMRAWMYANCYSLTRGVSRFVTLHQWADLLRESPVAKEAGVEIPEFRYLRRWAKVTNSLSPEAINKFIAVGDYSSILEPGDERQDADAELKDVVEWSNLVDKLAIQASSNIRAFPAAVKAIRALHELGVDICAVSGTPEKHVISHLEQYGILDCFRAIFAQQAGKKNLALSTMMAGYHAEIGDTPLLTGKEANYDICCMFGDAPQDYKEAKKANLNLAGKEDGPVRVFMIEVGRENESWQRFHSSVMEKFISDSWSSEEEKELIDKALGNLDRVWDPNVLPIDTYAKR